MLLLDTVLKRLTIEKKTIKKTYKGRNLNKSRRYIIQIATPQHYKWIDVQDKNVQL